VSRIRSEHVVRVHDIGELESARVPRVPYLVMETLGTDLAALLARRARCLSISQSKVLQACEALAEAPPSGCSSRSEAGEISF